MELIMNHDLNNQASVNYLKFLQTERIVDHINLENFNSFKSIYVNDYKVLDIFIY